MDGQPGDKSPGYYLVSLRDEVKTGFQMSKLRTADARAGPVNAPARKRFMAGGENSSHAPERSRGSPLGA
jgi:hypothetical protein